MATYDSEPVDRLAFGSADKAARYATDRYLGATGLNWWRCDPTLQFLMRSYLDVDELRWAEPHLNRMGALMGGPVSERAERTDKNPPRLERYDRWGHDVSEVVLPQSFLDSRRDILADSFTAPSIREDAANHGVKSLTLLGAAHSYMLDQAEIGMACALGTGGDMVVNLVRQFAAGRFTVREHVLAEFESGEWAGETIQSLTERTGGSDLAELETTATPAGDVWRINGFKWFASNANGQAWVVLAKPEGAPDNARGIATFLVLRERRDGSRNGIRIRRLKDKLGTKAVASAEVEFANAEAFLLSGQPSADSGAGDGRGLARMMELTNGARLGIAMMGLGCARRVLVEALCYARARDVFGKPLSEQPLMQRKLAELIVDVEAAQALVFDGFDPKHRLRIGAPLIKLRASRLGITAASDAIEVHGGNGYVENWPVARILRDAQVNTLWEGPDNILCLDVRRGIEREQADVAFLDRLREAVAAGPPEEATALVADRVEQLAGAIEHWKTLDRTTAEARLFPLAEFMVDVYAGALLVAQAGFERDQLGTDRKSLVARLYARRHLAEPSPLRGIDQPPEDLERFKDLWDGALVDNRV